MVGARKHSLDVEIVQISACRLGKFRDSKLPAEILESEDGEDDLRNIAEFNDLI